MDDLRKIGLWIKNHWITILGVIITIGLFVLIRDDKIRQKALWKFQKKQLDDRIKSTKTHIDSLKTVDINTQRNLDKLQSQRNELNRQIAENLAATEVRKQNLNAMTDDQIAELVEKELNR